MICVGFCMDGQSVETAAAVSGVGIKTPALVAPFIGCGTFVAEDTSDAPKLDEDGGAIDIALALAVVATIGDTSELATEERAEDLSASKRVDKGAE